MIHGVSMSVNLDMIVSRNRFDQNHLTPTWNCSNKVRQENIDELFTLPETNIAHENPHLSW